MAGEETEITYFWVNLGASAALFVVLMCLHSFFCRMKANRVIYYPNLLIRGGGLPDYLERWRPWGWMVEAFRTKESELVAIAGLDAAIYLQLFQTALTIIILSSIVCLPLLIPLAVTDENLKLLRENPNYDAHSNKLDRLTVGNVQPKSSRSWAFLGAMYWVSLVTYWALHRAYKHVVELRTTAQADVKAMPQQFACLVRDIPKLEKTEPPSLMPSEQVDNFFKEIRPDTYEKSLIATKLKKPSKLWTELETAKSKLAHAEAVHELSKTKTLGEGKRPQHRTGKFGLYGPKVDSIGYWNEKIKELSPVLQKEQTRTKEDKQQAAAVIFFNSRRAAAEVSQEKHSPFADRWQVLPAPEPRAVIWENMHVRFYSRLVREALVYVAVFLLVLFYIIPIIFIAAVTSLNSLTMILPFLDQIQEGIVSKTHLERAASGKMYYFVVFNVTVGCTIFGTLFQSANSLKKLSDAGAYNFNKMIDLFGGGLPHMGTYFITFVALRFCFTYAWELSRLYSLLYYHVSKKYLCKTEAEVMAAWAPGAIFYIRNIPYDLLVMTITLTYAVLAPLILPFGLAYFLIGWFVYRNQALKVYVANFESGGRFWPHIHNRFLVGLFVSQITAFAYFGIKKFKFCFLLIPLPFITLLFAMITRKMYYPSFNYISAPAASHEVKEVPTLHSLVDSFTPACLRSSSATTKNDKIDNSKYDDAESQLPYRTSSGVASRAEQQPVDVDGGNRQRRSNGRAVMPT